MMNLGNPEKKLLFKIISKLLIVVIFVSLAIFFTARTYDNYVRVSMVDSLQIKYELTIDSLQKENNLIDSLKNKEIQKRDSLQISVNTLERRVGNLRNSNKDLQAKADSLRELVDTDVCKEIVDAFVEVNDSLKSENVALDSLVKDWKHIAGSYNSQLTLCETQRVNDVKIINLKDSTISLMETRLNIERTINEALEVQKEKYKKRSELLPYGIAGGFIGGIIICLLIK